MCVVFSSSLYNRLSKIKSFCNCIFLSPELHTHEICETKWLNVNFQSVFFSCCCNARYLATLLTARGEHVSVTQTSFVHMRISSRFI